MRDALDFWLGRWTVHTADGTPAGTNHIERALDGRSVLEHWSGVDGSDGESLFWLDEAAGTWRQVWVGAGHHKEKTLVEHSPRMARFEGRAFAYERGMAIADRTTLTAERDGTVRQLIEYSLDDGANWTTSFDAVYVPA